MLLKFDNPTNGRFYWMLQHMENDKFALTIVRGGKTRKVLENYFYDDSESIHKEIERRKKRRLQRGYLINNITDKIQKEKYDDHYSPHELSGMICIEKEM